MNKIIAMGMFVLSLFCVSCSTCFTDRSKALRATPHSFLDIHSNTQLWLTRINTNDGTFVLIFSENKNKCVVLDLHPIDNSNDYVNNIGYGLFTVKGDLEFYSKDRYGVVYESQGGMSILSNFEDLIYMGLKEELVKVPSIKLGNLNFCSETEIPRIKW